MTVGTLKTDDKTFFRIVDVYPSSSTISWDIFDDIKTKLSKFEGFDAVYLTVISFVQILPPS